MTLQELKDSKKIPNISDSELIKIINEVFKVQPAISNMSFSLEDSMVEKIKYSPALMDKYIEQEMAKPGLDKSTQYSKVLKEIRQKQTELSSKPGFEEEKKYFAQKEQTLASEKLMLDSIMATFDKNKTKLANNIDLKSLQHLNKDALALFLMGMSGDLNSLLPFVQQLSSKVDQLYEEFKNAQTKQTTVSTPNGSDVVEDEMVEEPPLPEIIQTTRTTTQQQVKKGTIEDLKRQNIIPRDIKDEDLIKYCNEVLKFNPPIKDANFVFNQTHRERLENSMFIQNARIKKDIQREHKSVIKRYDEIIGNYKSMLSKMQGNPKFEDEIAKVTELIGTLESERASYRETVMNFDGQSIDEYFDFAVSNNAGIASLVSNHASAIATEKEDKTVALDAEISSLANQKQRLESVNARNIFTKMKRDANIKRLTSRIERLKKKQGRIKSSQRKLIDFSTEKYKKRMEKEFRKFQREQEKLDLAVQQKMNKLEDLNEKQSKIDRLNQKIVSLEEKKKTVSDFAKARIDGKKSKLEARRERIEKAKKRLEEKIGRIDLSQQYQTSFNDNFAYSI